MSMISVFMYDFALFMIFAVNIMFHEDTDFASTELSLFGSCLLFGILFEIVGRKRIFTMRLLVTSVCSLFVPFLPIIEKSVPILGYVPVQSLSFVMCSVSLTVPVVSDFVKYRRRGVAYGYMGLILAIATVGMNLISTLNIDESKNGKEWLFVGTSVFGIIVALSFCSFMKDR